MRKSEKVCCVLATVSMALGLSMLFRFTSVRFTGALFCCAAAALVLFALLTRWKENNRRILWIRRIFLALTAAGFAFFAVLEIWIVSYSRTDDKTPATAVIVLGAGVNGTEPSLSLAVRLEAALEYVRDKPDIPVVVSGAQGRGEAVSEARCMADWLISRGVGPDRIILEERAANTKENIRYSMEMLEERGLDPAGNIAVVTSDYHLRRASLYMAGNMVPVAARMPARFLPLTLNYYVREAFAIAALYFSSQRGG